MMGHLRGFAAAFEAGYLSITSLSIEQGDSNPSKGYGAARAERRHA